MDTLNISATILYANRLKEQRERARAAEEARIKAEEERRRIEEERQKTVEQPKRTEMQAQANIPFIPAEPTPETQPAQPELLTRAFKVTTTRENIIALGNFMNDMGIDFDKIEVP